MFTQSKNPYEVMEVNHDLVQQFSEGYIDFLNKCKTEREVFDYCVNVLNQNGFELFDNSKNYGIGDKIYFTNRNKSVSACVIGADDLWNGVNIIASHIDSPRLDLKVNPIHEDSQFAMLRTHYYGGIKKYQWTTIPLSLRGTVVTTTGKIELNLGNEDDDFGFTITDLLPHLASEQYEKKLNKAIEAENLQVIVGTVPDNTAEKKKVKANLLKLLKDNYGIEEEDFVSADLSFVPAFKAKSIGFDKSLVGGYGQDDRVCAYASLMSFLELSNLNKTAFLWLADKEEIGSEGNTGVQSSFFYNSIYSIAKSVNNIADYVDLTHVLSSSKCLSADVNAGFDPLYKSVHEKSNASQINHGVILTKFTGRGGKSGSSDSGAEFLGYLRILFNNNNIAWQVGELGKIDIGGGGTVAKFIANHNVDVIDVGVSILSMHSPYEVSSKLDIYESYKAYKAFYEA